VILINLLPHREERRKRRKTAFFVVAGAAGVLGASVALVGYLILQQMISGQQGRNAFLQEEIVKLEDEIKDVSTLRAQIDALKARQKAVEDLQVGRNMPVNVLSDLVNQTPEGMYILGLTQEGDSLTLNGVSLSNERVSDFLRNTNDSEWLTRPELISIEAAKTNAGSIERGKDSVRLLDFSMRIGIKRPPENKVAPASGSASSPNAAEPKV
jgi:type IV pilus assembly protein PilN